MEMYDKLRNIQGNPEDEYNVTGIFDDNLTPVPDSQKRTDLSILLLIIEAFICIIFSNQIKIN